MSIYRVKLFPIEPGPCHELVLDYLNDDAALDDLGLIDHQGRIEVWRDQQMIGRFVATGGPAD